MKTKHARQIQLTKMYVRKIKKVLYIVSNIFSHHIARTFLAQSFDFHHFTTHIYSSHPCDKWVPVTTAWRVLRLRMEELPPIWRVAANILNKQSRTADEGWSSSLGVGPLL